MRSLRDATGAASSLSMDILPVYVSHALQVASLPAYHGDPFDRLLVAQAQIEKLPLMTADAMLVEYDVETGSAKDARRGADGGVDASP